MNIDISNHRKIYFIQQEFSGLFPNLKIDFYEKASKQPASSKRRLVPNSNRTLAECRSAENTGSISILPEMTVGQLHQDFGSTYSLSIDIFPKISANTWAEEPVSGDGTLAELNEKAVF
ncbi:hypothetical protein ACTHGU_14155 [Chitinophagaceae bacterium MMS25-I14]